MAEQNTNSNQQQEQQKSDTEFKLKIEDVVVEKIAAISLMKVDGILEMKGGVFSSIQEGFGGEDKTKGINADVHDGKTASVDLSIIIEYGKSANEIFNNMKRVVTRNVKEMTSLDIDEMTVHVSDVMTRDEFKQKRSNNKDDDK